MAEIASRTVRGRLIASIAFWGALAALVALAAAGPLVRIGMPFSRAIPLMLSAAIAGAAFALLGLALLFLRRKWPAIGLWRPLGAVGLGALAAGILIVLLQSARGVPPIHDISTDTEDPPQFAMLLPARADAPNPAAYAGAEVAAQQRAAYPDIVPLRVELAPRAALDRVRAALEAEGLAVVGADPGAGTVEASATTLWFGFKDDVVARVRPADGGGTVIDLRSKSRMGQSDLGANAARIREISERIVGSG